MASPAVSPAPAPAPVSAPQGSPEPIAVQPAAAPAATPVEPAPAPNQATREALYQKYYSASGQPPQPVEPVQAPVGGEPPAQGGPEPAPAGEPAPGSGPAAPDIDQRFADFEQRIAAMLQQMMGGPAQAPAPTTPTPQAQPADWLELLRQGKVAEGEQALAGKISAVLEDQLANRTLEAVRVETELTKFVTDLRTANQDILDLEDWIGARSRSALDAVIAANKIQSSADYIREYKAAVNAAVDEARKIAQKFRAAGKNEALTTRTQVLSASTLTPNPVDANRQPAPAQEPQAESAESYLQKRLAEQLARKGFVA